MSRAASRWDSVCIARKSGTGALGKSMETTAPQTGQIQKMNSPIAVVPSGPYWVISVG